MTAHRPAPLTRRHALVAGLMLPPALTGCGGPAIAQRGGAAALPDFADLAERVLPAVVNISVASETQSAIPQEFRGTPLERYFRGRRERTMGAGSGFVIDPGGFIVTNNHVVGNASRVTVSLQGGQELQARVVGSDELMDLALLRVEPRNPLIAVPWGSSGALRVGQWVLAAGNPFGLGGSVTSGIVSARGRDIGAGPFDDFIQTDAAINPGNSGGPLFNVAGEVVGINTAIYSPSGANAGIGFATPSDLARPVIEGLRRDGRVERGWLGVQVQDLVAEDPRAGRRAVLIAGVERNGPAARAGLRSGDVVLSINGQPAETSRMLVRSIAAVPPGQSVRLTLLRDGRTQDLSVQVGRRPGGTG
ncbi:trypsin-like peptidase domain-containing protein [Sabulicella glaciei]|uniref:Trypsin-like peptidase domain-containing protein n=1 Tax=Sabulicella glaciei TaxID=2984948 RepID=A0ABT3NR30_9PROT|nr:trypsin-like peptidase domain-containing protein [Roseococcus sp. MDT2-1-1]MCW8084054.1 trypsin-like peptidase domain-containing protein [Roseococcus sp. MDT2-1-1]